MAHFPALRAGHMFFCFTLWLVHSVILITVIGQIWYLNVNVALVRHALTLCHLSRPVQTLLGGIWKRRFHSENASNAFRPQRLSEKFFVLFIQPRRSLHSLNYSTLKLMRQTHVASPLPTLPPMASSPPPSSPSPSSPPWPHHKLSSSPVTFSGQKNEKETCCVVLLYFFLG